jgi:hypothetical protein
MISGAHLIFTSKDAEADRIFLRDVLKLTHVDLGQGWLMFGLPPSNIVVHADEPGPEQKFLLMCDDIAALVSEVEMAGQHCTPPFKRSGGIFTTLTLPSGAQIGVYQPDHAHPPA